MMSLFKRSKKPQLTRLSLKDILGLVETCGFEDRLVEILVCNFSELELEKYLRSLVIDDLADIQNQIFSDKTIRGISFNEPSSYLTLLESKNLKEDTSLWVYRFQCLEDLTTRLMLFDGLANFDYF